MKTIFEMMSLHCVPYIPYWMNTGRMKIYTYCQIIYILSNYLSKFHKYGSYNFFPSGRPQLANHTLPLSAFVYFCLNPLPPPLICRHPLWMAPYSNTDPFLWNLQNFLKNTYFEEHVRKTASNCFTSEYYNNKWWRVWTRRELDRVHFIQSNAAT